MLELKENVYKFKVVILCEKGSNFECELVYVLYLVGFEVWDVYMIDLMIGREMLEDI